MNLSEPSQQQKRQSFNVRMSACVCCLIVTVVASTGCQRRAHTELYVENINARNRDLEDQLYKYDYEYRMLEQELRSLRAENAQLRNADEGSSSARNPLRFFSPRPDAPTEAEELEGAGESESANSSSEPPSIIESPKPGMSSGNLPSPPSSSRGSNGDAEPNDFGTEPLAPPTIDPGEAMPPPLPARGNRADNGSDALQRNLGQVEIPALLASQSKTIEEGEDSDAALIELTPAFGGASLRAAVAELTDTRVVELAFHSSLSRAANFDDELDDDGLYLLLQPKNESGQVVPIAADLSVVVLDPARTGKSARISRRDYSANEVKSKLQLSGKHQGIHLTMPWNGPDPEADRVIVFARYTFPDGRQVIGEKTIFVSSEGGLRTVWAPRAESSGEREGSVRSASHEHSSRTSNSGSVIPAGGSSSIRLVRPPVGSTTSPDAPAPTLP